MAYQKSNFKDTIKDAEGNIIQKGTPVNAATLGKIEDGIVQAEQKIDVEIGKVATQLAQKAKKQEVLKSHKRVTKSNSILHTGEHNKAVLCSIISDDGSMADWEKLKPFFASKNVKYGMGIITSIVGTSGYMSWSQIDEMVSEGHEVLCHTHNHLDATVMTAKELDEDLQNATQILAQHGHYPDGFVYPYNNHNTTTRKIVSKYFSHAFAKTPNSFANIGRNYPTINNQVIARIAVGSFFDNTVSGFDTDTKSLNYYKQRVDEAITNNNWLVLVLHPWHTDHTDTQQQHLSDLIDYIKSKGVEIVLPSEGFTRYGNIMQIGDVTETVRKFWVDGNGGVDAYFNKYIVDNANAHTSNDVYTSYAQTKTTITPITAPFATSDGGFPSNLAGVLKTYRYSSNYYDCKQEFAVAAITQTASSGRRNKVYERFVNSDGTWTAWRKVDELFFDVTSAPFSVPAQNTYDLTLDCPGVLLQDITVAMPFAANTLPNGIMYSLLRTNANQVILRFANVTTFVITVHDIRWAITVKPR